MIIRGFVALNEMPKDIRNPAMTKERAEWVLANAREYAKGHLEQQNEEPTEDRRNSQEL